MHQRKYFNSNFFINEIFSVEKFPNYGIYIVFPARDKNYVTQAFAHAAAILVHMFLVL